LSGNPEVKRGFVAGSWRLILLPTLDGSVIFARMVLSSNELTWFEQREIYAAKVRNASKVGSQLHTLQVAAN